MTDIERDELIAAALDAQQRAYCKYSDFAVGAALRTASGGIFQGANIENASFGLTICAERVAGATAIAAGEQDFVSLAIASPTGVSPCGACRQFLAEFNPDLAIIMVDSAEPSKLRESNLAKLLPARFEGPV